MTDRECIEGVFAGRKESFDVLYRQYRSSFFGYIRNKCNKSDEYIADLYQETCIDLWMNITNQRLSADSLNNTKLKTYLFTIGKNKLISQLRKEENNPFVNIETANIGDIPDENDDTEAYEKTVNDAVAKLQPPCKTLLSLFYWDKKNINEIAIKMEYKNSDTAKNMKYKCMQRLKDVVVFMLK